MIVSWMTTNKCNLKCVHCYQDAEEATDRELSTEEAMKMIDEIAHAGFKIMIFSGGEPLLRPDIFDLVAHAARAIIARAAEAAALVRRITTKATFLRKTITALTA